MIGILLGGAALAGPCDVTTGIATGPVSVGFVDGDLGVARRLCPRTEVALTGGGFAIVELENFYGRIAAGPTLEGSWAFSDRGEVYAGIEALRYETVITPIPADYLGFGHTSLGATYRFWETEAVGVGAHARAVLPTAVGLYQNAWPVAADLGVGVQWAAHRTLRVHGDATGIFSAAISQGPALPWGGARLTGGVEWQPVRPFGLTADLLAGFGYADPVDHVAAALGIRTGIGKRVGIDLAAAYPFAGRERALASGELRVNVVLGKVGE